MKTMTKKVLQFLCKPHNVNKKGIVLKSDGSIFYKSKIHVLYGKNNIIDFKSSKLIKSHISIGGFNNSIIFGNNCNIHDLNIIIEGNNNKIVIGDNVVIGGYTDLICCHGTSVFIGSGCLFSRNIVIRTWDGHKIYQNSKWINTPQDINISNNVWFCERAAILGGSSVSNDSIVAFSAVVTKQFAEPNVVLAGIPARVVKAGVKWER